MQKIKARVFNLKEETSLMLEFWEKPGPTWGSKGVLLQWDCLGELLAAAWCAIETALSSGGGSDSLLHPKNQKLLGTASTPGGLPGHDRAHTGWRNSNGHGNYDILRGEKARHDTATSPPSGKLSKSLQGCSEFKEETEVLGLDGRHLK